MSEINEKTLLGLQMMQDFFGEELFTTLRSQTVSHISENTIIGSYTDKNQQEDDLPSKVSGEYIAETCFSSYARPGFSFRDRSLMNIVILVALNRGPELRIHIAAGLKNGLSEEQICEACRHAMVYCGVPVGRDALVIAGQIFRQVKQGKSPGGPKLA